MNKKYHSLFVLFVLCTTLTTGWAKSPDLANYSNSFDKEKAGVLPAGWCVNATRPRGTVADWEIVQDSAAPSPGQALAITRINDVTGRQYNICWNKSLTFKDGDLEVKICANYGETDQGGGLAWRIKDPANYYFARYNPLEHILRLFYVKEGIRNDLAIAYDIPISSREWFTMKVVQRGDSVKCFLNGKNLISIADKTFPSAGGAGIWSKADSATSFDDFKMTSYRE